VAGQEAFAAACCARAARTGQSIFLPVVSSAALRLWTLPPAWAYLDSVDVSSVIVAPLRTNRRVYGMLLLWREQQRPSFVESDRIFAEDVTRRLAPAFAAPRRQGGRRAWSR
jgi:hypothetical protein